MPLTPKEVRERRLKSIPSEVMEVVDEMLVENFQEGGETRLDQSEVLARVSNRMNLSNYIIIQKGWLDFEEHYRKAGWIVVYDKPGYNESYSAFWAFREKRS